jgi:hypothetical protein
MGSPFAGVTASVVVLPLGKGGTYSRHLSIVDVVDFHISHRYLFLFVIVERQVGSALVREPSSLIFSLCFQNLPDVERTSVVESAKKLSLEP